MKKWLRKRTHPLFKSANKKPFANLPPQKKLRRAGTWPTQNYSYSPIEDVDEIRLFTFSEEERKEGDLSKCYLTHHKLSSCPPYIGLSYVWGDPHLTDRIMCNDEPFLVTQNLSGALKELAHGAETSKVRHFWVDQICIDQSNPEEQSQQVQMMRRIYSSADEVYIWIGAEDTQTNIGLQMIDKFLALVDGLGGRSLDDLFAASAMLEIDNFDWGAFGAILSRGWFRRVWTVQEAAVAKKATIFCGGSNISWDTFHRMIAEVMASNTVRVILGQAQPLPRTNADHAIRQIRAIGVVRGLQMYASDIELYPYDALTTLYNYRMCEASDSRDKVFSLIGIMSKPTSAVFKAPNYTRPVDEVFLEVAVDVIHRYENLDVLHHAGHTTNEIDIPSWVPDWGFATKGTTLWVINNEYISKQQVSGILEPVPLFTAGGVPEDSKYEISDDDKLLTVRGKLFGSVVHIVRDFQVDFEQTQSPDQDFAAVLARRWEKMMEAMGYLASWSYYPNGETPQMAWVQTLIRSQLEQGTRTPADVIWRAYDAHMDLLAYMRAQDAASLPYDQARVLSYLEFGCQKYGVSVGDATIGHVFFTTDDGYMGLGTEHLQAGDRLVVVAGCAAPFIIRKSGEHWKLVGEGYTHGLMDGEAGAMVDRVDVDVVLE